MRLDPGARRARHVIERQKPRLAGGRVIPLLRQAQGSSVRQRRFRRAKFLYVFNTDSAARASGLNCCSLIVSLRAY
ncbi:hypothetical protein, partial [Burkholderia multivorans]|uniref:hypothetical protein n=1 Tax=Burkholderia multivorans TaxID=87883 RepID=UPI001ED957BF